MPQVALLVFLVYVAWLMYKDTRRRQGISGSVWAIVVWLIITGSRPVSSWFNFGGGGGSAAENYDAGNPFERQVYLLLIVFGFWVLFKRGVRLQTITGNNKWLYIFYLYWAFSVLWSDAPVVAFKRWFKDVGNIVMLLVLLTENNPMEAIKAAFVRCAYVVAPFSLLLI